MERVTPERPLRLVDADDPSIVAMVAEQRHRLKLERWMRALLNVGPPDEPERKEHSHVNERK